MSKEFKKRIPFIVLASLLLGFLETVGIVIIFPIIALIVDPASVLNFSLYKKIAPYLPRDFALNGAALLAPIMISIFISKNILMIILNRWQIYLINDQAKNTSIGLFKRYANMPYLNSLNRDTSYLNFSILSAGALFYNAYVTPLLQLFSEVIMIAALISMLFLLDVQIALTSFALTFILGGVTFAVTKKKLKQIGIENRFHTEMLVRIIKESFSNFKEFKILGRESFFTNRFNQSKEKTAGNQSQQMTLLMINRHAIEILLFLATALVAYMIISNNLKAVALAQLGLYAMVIIRLIPSITKIFTSLQTMKTAETSIDLLIDEYKEIKEPLASSIPLASDSISLEKPTIIFNKVCFSYPDQKKTALQDITLKIKPNTAVGIVGKTGSGKTTLVDILLGLIPYSQGVLSINNQPIESILPFWTKHLGYVPQKVCFMRASLLENIAYGIARSDIDLDRIKQVVPIAQLDDDIAYMENGLETLLSEDASNLSGGQKQRIGIARALYNKPSLLVLDEATSALDVKTESKLSASIMNIKKHCTIIIITHQLRTIRNCDNILYIKKGKLEAQGTFDELSLGNKDFMEFVKLSEVQRKTAII